MSDLKNEAKSLIQTPMELISMILQRHNEAILEEIRDQVKKLTAERNDIRDRYYDLVMQVAQKWPDETRHDTAKRYIMEREETKESAAKQALGGDDE